MRFEGDYQPADDFTDDHARALQDEQNQLLFWVDQTLERAQCFRLSTLEQQLLDEYRASLIQSPHWLHHNVTTVIGLRRRIFHMLQERAIRQEPRLIHCEPAVIRGNALDADSHWRDIYVRLGIVARHFGHHYNTITKSHTFDLSFE